MGGQSPSSSMGMIRGKDDDSPNRNQNANANANPTNLQRVVHNRVTWMHCVIVLLLVIASDPASSQLLRVVAAVSAAATATSSTTPAFVVGGCAAGRSSSSIRSRKKHNPFVLSAEKVSSSSSNANANFNSNSNTNAHSNHHAHTLSVAAQSLVGPPYIGPIAKPILDSIVSPADLKQLSMRELNQLATELRWEVLETVSKTGGHLSSSLGVNELTIALHYVFAMESGDASILWDVSHQCYPHKILTGRRHQMRTLRQLGGLSGFCKRAESPVYDSFGAGHSSTSISAAQGMSIARSLLRKKTNHCIAVIGDGAITGGMAYEAMNSAGYLQNRLLVILNDNGQVSLPTGTPSAGGTVPASQLSTYTSNLLVSQPFQNVRDFARSFNQLLPEPFQDVNKRIDEYARSMVTGGAGTLFEELGFYYVGPVDGHDLDNLIPILEKIRDRPPSSSSASATAHGKSKPILLHLKTIKGHGYPPAECASDRMHGVGQFDVRTGKPIVNHPKLPAALKKPILFPPTPTTATTTTTTSTTTTTASASASAQSSSSPPQPQPQPSLTSVFAHALMDAATYDRTIVGITAAMPGGTGMDIFGKRFPQRTFDVGIAEQHAVTLAAGMVTQGLKPFVCIYSTFLQRGYDQVVHDVAVQNLPVRLVLDRAGLVGNDGPTHHGCYDLAYLGCIPNLIIMAPSDEVELKHMVATQAACDHAPSVLRYPRGTAYGPDKLRTVFGYTTTPYPEEDVGVGVDGGPATRTSTATEEQSNTRTITRTSSTSISGKVLPIGKGRIIRRPGGFFTGSHHHHHPNTHHRIHNMANAAKSNARGKNRNDRVAILSIGTRLQESLMAAQQVEEDDDTLGVTVADARFMKPLDVDLVRQLADDHSVLITIEEGSIGGFGDHVLHFLSLDGLLDDGALRFRPMVIPDAYFETATQYEQYEQAGLNAKHIRGTILRLTKRLQVPQLQST